MISSDYIKNQLHIRGKILIPNPYSALAEFPPLAYSTDNVTKDHIFYGYILVDSRSVEITYYPDKSKPYKSHTQHEKFMAILFQTSGLFTITLSNLSQHPYIIYKDIPT